MSRKLVSLLALAFIRFLEACLHRDKLILLAKQARRVAGMTMRNLEKIYSCHSIDLSPQMLQSEVMTVLSLFAGFHFVYHYNGLIIRSN